MPDSTSFGKRQKKYNSSHSNLTLPTNPIWKCAAAFHTFAWQPFQRVLFPWYSHNFCMYTFRVVTWEGYPQLIQRWYFLQTCTHLIIADQNLFYYGRDKPLGFIYDISQMSVEISLWAKKLSLSKNYENYYHSLLCLFINGENHTH